MFGAWKVTEGRKVTCARGVVLELRSVYQCVGSHYRSYVDAMMCSGGKKDEKTKTDVERIDIELGEDLFGDEVVTAAREGGSVRLHVHVRM